VTSSDLVVRTGRTPAEVARLADRLAREGEVLPVGDRAGTLLHARWYERHRQNVLSILAAHHRENPLMIGLAREELRERILPGGEPEIARFVLERMARAGEIRLEKEFAAAAAHQVSLGEEEERILELVESAFRGAGLNPAGIDEIVAGNGLDAARARRIYHLLLTRGRLVKIKGGTVFHAETLERLKGALWDLRSKRPVIDVAAFKELTGTSRKNAIPLLEHLDAERVTRRRGNDREILPPPGAAAS
jgi:selenocysteine-specific elongation factor